MNNRSWIINPLRINFATVYEDFIEKPFSFFLMVVVTAAVYKFISIEALFIFEFFSIVISLIISFKEKIKLLSYCCLAMEIYQKKLQNELE